MGRGRSHDARGAGAVAASVPCDSGAGRRWGNALTGGAGCQRQNVGKGGAAAVARELGHGNHGGSWADSLLGRAKLAVAVRKGGEGSWASARKGLRAETEEGREWKEISFFFL